MLTDAISGSGEQVEEIIGGLWGLSGTALRGCRQVVPVLGDARSLPVSSYYCLPLSVGSGFSGSLLTGPPSPRNPKIDT